MFGPFTVAILEKTLLNFICTEVRQWSRRCWIPCREFLDSALQKRESLRSVLF